MVIGWAADCVMVTLTGLPVTEGPLETWDHRTMVSDSLDAWNRRRVKAMAAHSGEDDHLFRRMATTCSG